MALSALVLSASAGAARTSSGRPLNQCIALIDPAPCALAPLQFLFELQRQRALAGRDERTPVELRGQLRHLQEQRRAFVALHGESAAGPVIDLDNAIRAVSVVLRPLLVLNNPTAHEILKALPQTPDNGLLVVLDQTQCQTLANPQCSAVTRYLARTLARGFAGDSIIPEWRHPKGTVEVTVAPRLSIIFTADRRTVARLLISPALRREGLADNIIPVDANASLREADNPAFYRAIKHVINARDLYSSDSFAVGQEPVHAKPEFARASKVHAAIEFWREHVAGQPVSPEETQNIAQALEQTRSSLLLEQAQAGLLAEEALILEKLRKIGHCCKMRELARLLRTEQQRREFLDPILERLEEKRLVGRTVDGRIFVMPKEGEEGPGLRLLTC